jgi:hypothetical protein
MHKHISIQVVHIAALHVISLYRCLCQVPLVVSASLPFPACYLLPLHLLLKPNDDEPSPTITKRLG